MVMNRVQFYFLRNTRMNQTQFMEKLQSVARTYRWEYSDNQLVGTARYGKLRGSRFNPITAVARAVTGNYYPLTSQGLLKASKALGITSSLVDSVLSDSNRGNAQVVRGKLLRSVQSSTAR